MHEHHITILTIFNDAVKCINNILPCWCVMHAIVYQHKHVTFLKIVHAFQVLLYVADIVVTTRQSIFLADIVDAYQQCASRAFIGGWANVKGLIDINMPRGCQLRNLKTSKE